MNKYKFIFNLAAVCLVFVLLLSLARFTGIERSEISVFEKTTKTIVAPFQSGVTGVIQKIKDVFGLLGEVKALREENILLKQKISQLNQQINLLNDYKLENIRLRELLNYKGVHKEDFSLLSARVIARDPTNWYSTIIINRGSQEGVKKDMAVVTPQGLVGRIINVTPQASEVLLILDQEGAVGARVWETRETSGVIEGKGEGSNLLTMIHLPHDSKIEVGHTIVTSGLGGIFPPGIRIGKVVEIVEETSGLMKKAAVEPFVDFSRLEEVLIILDVNEAYKIRQDFKKEREEALEQ